MYETRREKLLTPIEFAWRMVRHGTVAVVMIAASLALGTFGYHWLADLGWVDSLLNAAMILTGMGPVDPMRSTTAKLFATAYALFSGVIFLSIAGILVAPALHRLLHRFHFDDEEKPRKK
jgi:hypothetical protein